MAVNGQEGKTFRARSDERNPIGKSQRKETKRRGVDHNSAIAGGQRPLKKKAKRRKYKSFFFRSENQ